MHLQITWAADDMRNQHSHRTPIRESPLLLLNSLNDTYRTKIQEIVGLLCTGKFLLRWGGYGDGLVQPSRLICWIQSCGMMRTLSGVLHVYYRTFAADSRPPSDPSSENLNCGDDRIEKEENNMLYLMSGFSKPCCFSQLQFSFQ